MKTKHYQIKLIQSAAIVVAFLFIISCKKDCNEPDPDPIPPGPPFEVETVTDIDGNVYEAVIVGTQTWFTENLKVGHYNNGDPIDHITSFSNWKDATSGAYCTYNNKPENTDSTLYNWFTVNDNRKLCPEGWHIPSDDEWKVLEGNMDTKYGVGNSVWDKWFYRGYDAGLNMKSLTGWLSNGNGKGYFGINMAPAGMRYMQDDIDFFDHGYSAWLWTSTEYTGNLAWIRFLSYEHKQSARLEKQKESGLSVRCIKD